MENKMKIIPATKPYVDYEVAKKIGTMDFQKIFHNPQWHFDSNLQKEFLDTFNDWIQTSELNHVTGLEKFPHRLATVGISQALDEFHYTHRDKRIRLFRGEYDYQTRVLADRLVYVDDENPIENGDALLLSTPFAGCGNVREDYDDILTICSEKEVPVLIDCAYFGICKDLNISTDYPCIENVCFSLSKPFGLGNLRIGMMYSNIMPPHIAAINTVAYTPLLTAQIGLMLMDEYTPDFAFNKFRPIQEQICSELDNVEPSNTVIIGLGDKLYDDTWIDKQSGWFRYGLGLELTDRQPMDFE